MNNPIILERDCKVQNWVTPLAGFPTTGCDISVDDFATVRSDGQTYENYGVLHIHQNCGPASLNAECVGLHITGPEEDIEFSELTPYKVEVSAMCEEPNLRPFLFMGISPDTPGNGPSGQQVDNCRIIAVGSCDSGGGHLNASVTIGVAELPSGYETNALCFGVGFHNETGGASADTTAWAEMTVRRLIVHDPLVLNTRKH